MPTQPTNIEAHFLGPKGENAEFFKTLLAEAIDRHVIWRQSFGASDPEFVDGADRDRPDFLASQAAIRASLEAVFERLKLSQPFFSPRYIGHMNWDVLTSAAVAYFQAALFNPNNVAHMGSTATTMLEIEVGEDLCRLLGFDPVRGWAHLTAGGTTANMEAIWMARNLKYLPVALRSALLEAGADLTIEVAGRACSLVQCEPEQLIRSVASDAALDAHARSLALFPDPERQKRFEDLLERHSLQQRGINGLDLGVLFVPQTKHYSWKKIVDLLGLGRDALRFVPVDGNFRMDAAALERMLRAETRPILAAVAVVGSTEESSVDPVDRVLALREALLQEGKAFHVHVDAAYGGYAASLFRDEDGRWLELEEIQAKLEQHGIVSAHVPGRHHATWPSAEVYKAFRAIAAADSVTLDPHKLGYIQYPAGGVAYRNRGLRNAIASFAPYVFPKPKPGDPDILIGAYILEGSKPGAAAAAVWTAHRTLPLNLLGYGKLIGEGIDGAHALHHGLLHHLDCREPRLGGRKVIARTVTAPDLNIVLYAFNL